MDNTPYGRNQHTIRWWSENRNRVEDLYPSESYFFNDRLRDCSSVADIGCAAGGFSQIVASLNGDATYVGIDVSSNLIDVARQLYPNGTFLHYNGQTLPPEALNVDMCFSFGVLHHVQAWPNLVVEMISASRKHVCFDLRLTKNSPVGVIDLQDSYQKIEFGGEWDGQTTIPYLVLHEEETIQTISQMLPTGAALRVYGYGAKPNKVVVTPYQTVTMASFCIDINAGETEVTLEISD